LQRQGIACRACKERGDASVAAKGEQRRWLNASLGVTSTGGELDGSPREMTIITFPSDWFPRRQASTERGTRVPNSSESCSGGVQVGGDGGEPLTFKFIHGDGKL